MLHNANSPLGKFIECGKGQWHEECFVCCECRNPVESKYITKENDMYCVKCYENKFCPKCTKCWKVRLCKLTVS